MRFDPNPWLSLVDGCAALLSGLFLVFVFVPLFQQSRRQGFDASDWFLMRLPEAFHFRVAVLVFNSGFFLIELLRWKWRSFDGGGTFDVWQGAALVLSGTLLVTGMLCKIRSITDPIYGMRPWMASLAALIVFVAATLIW